jgi:hypothetical protein
VAIDLNRDHRALSSCSPARPTGFTTRVLVVHGIRLKLLADLAEAGLVSMKIEPVIGGSGSYATEVTRVQITEVGRQALAQ